MMVEVPFSRAGSCDTTCYNVKKGTIKTVVHRVTYGSCRQIFMSLLRAVLFLEGKSLIGENRLKRAKCL